MKTLAQIRQQFAAGQFDFSRHAFKRAVERDISEEEVRMGNVEASLHSCNALAATHEMIRPTLADNAYVAHTMLGGQAAKTIELLRDWAVPSSRGTGY